MSCFAYGKRFFNSAVKLFLVFLLCSLGRPFNGYGVEEKLLEITSIDRTRIQFSSGESVELAGLDMRELANKKKNAVVFSDEVNRFLQTFVHKKVSLEYEESLTPNRREKSAYVYYLTDVGGVSMEGGADLGAQPVLMIEQVKDNKGQLEAKVSPHIRVMLNMEILKKGYARVDRKQSFKYKKQFLLAERQSELNEIGIWG